MKGLFVQTGDDCTYSCYELIFAFDDNMITSNKLINAIKNSYPEITEDQILSLLIDFEYIETRNKVTGYIDNIFIDNVPTLDNL